MAKARTARTEPEASPEASQSHELRSLRHPDAAWRRFASNLAPPERWTPSEWAEQCRVLGTEETSEPGTFRFDRTPYFRGILDAKEQTAD